MSDSSSAGDDDSAIELFLWCRNLGARDKKTFDAFAVVMMQRTEDGPFEELQRSETICNTSNPKFCTSFEVQYAADADYSPTLRFDVYERKTVDTERLRDHEHRGTVCASVEGLLNAEGNHLSLLLHHPHEPRDVGTVTVAAEPVDTTNNQNPSVVQLDVSSSVLRKRDWHKTLLSQRYELSRAHKFDDEDGNTVWLPVYRSDRMTKQRDSTVNVEFSTASVKYRHLCNGDEERAMRLTMYAVPQVIGKPIGKKQEVKVAHADFTLRFVCEIDPTVEVLCLEQDGSNVDMGVVSIVKAEPTDFGSYFSFQVNYEHTAKYTSTGSIGKKSNGVKLKRLKMPSKKSLAMGNRSEGKKIPIVPDGLFSNDSSASEGSGPDLDEENNQDKENDHVEENGSP